MAQEYTTVRLLKSSYRLVKIEAAKRGIPLSVFLDAAVRAEIKNAARNNK